MNIKRVTKWTVTVGRMELIQALRHLNPENILIQALPADGSGVMIQATAGGPSVDLIYSKEG